MGFMSFAQRLTGVFANRGRFGRSAMVMVTGTVIAQAIPVALSPILTRIFTPSDFGVLAIFLAAMNIAATVAAGRYDLAIMLTKEEEDADALVVLCCTIAVGLGLVCALVIALFGNRISAGLNRPELGLWLYALPAGLTLTGIYGALTQWFNRRAAYGKLSRNRVLQAVLTGVTQIGLGKAGAGYGGMISGQMIGLFASTAALVPQFVRGRWTMLFAPDTRRRAARMASVYKRHPLHIMPAQWFGVFAMQMPVFIATAAFGATAAGFYHLAYRVIAMPAGLVGTAVGEVYRQHASEAYREEGEFSHLHMRTTVMMMALGLVPLAVLLVAAPPLFAFVFGEEWRVAGDYARILSIAAFAQFAFLPVDKAALIVGATRYIIGWNVVMVFLLGLLAYFTLQFDLSVEFFVSWLTVIIAGMYLADVLFEYNFSRGARMWLPGFGGSPRSAQ